MAHEIRTFAYTGDPAWHGLGNKLEPGQSIEQWIEAAGLNWTVVKSPLKYLDKTWDDQYVLHRSDDDHHPFAVVGKQYKPVQPKEVLEFYRDLVADMGFTIETAGELFHGDKVWALAKCGEGFELPGNDKVLPYLLLTTGYDGQTATVGKFTTTRVVCNNTLTASLNNTRETRVRVGHRSNFDAVGMKDQLGMSVEVFDSFRMATEALAKVKLDNVKAKEFINKILNINEESRDIDIATSNYLQNMFNTNSYIGAGMESSNGTAWGLLNCFTEFHDHRKMFKDSNKRLEHAWFGAGDALKTKAFQHLVAETA
jgi:phage/plasmid-like protein (TIGR03299 family)